MGPSWYWMPGVFEEFFASFDKNVADYYELKRLDPSYRVFFNSQESLDVPADYQAFKRMIEVLEPGSGPRLDKFIKEAKAKYEASMNEFVWKPSHSISEYVSPQLLRSSFRMQLFSSFSNHARRYFSHPKILKLLEFPILFLGAKPEKTPAMYSMMNYADIILGTWYPIGGMVRIGEAMTKLANELGVKIITSSDVKKIQVSGNKAHTLFYNNTSLTADAVVAAADYHHVERNLLEPEFRSYKESYWESRAMSPSTLIFYVGIDKKVEGLEHHNLFFDQDFEAHARAIYDDKAWPSNPLFYVCCPSRTDHSVAPAGKENVFILIPVATGLTSSEEDRRKYFDQCLDRIKVQTGEDLSGHIEYYRSYAHEEFIQDYHSFKGNAYGLANTLRQTAVFKPKMKSRRVKNLFYAGQLTVPGPGVPPSIISGRIAAVEVENYLTR